MTKWTGSENDANSLLLSLLLDILNGKSAEDMIRSKQLAAARQLHSTGNFLGAIHRQMRIESESGAKLVRDAVDGAPQARCFRYHLYVAPGLG
jgi:hypothetical protein